MATRLTDDDKPLPQRPGIGLARLPPAPLPVEFAEDSGAAPVAETEATPPESPQLPPEDAPFPVTFQGVTPGVSTRDDVVEAFGPPRRERSAGEFQLLEFRVDPYPSVEVKLDKAGLAVSLQLTVAEELAPVDATRRLSIGGYRSAGVLHPEGQLLGIAYPERGVVFGLRTVDEQTHVRTILLEPIQADLFVLRVRNDKVAECTRRLADLDQALLRDPKNSEAAGLKARILNSLGRRGEALAFVREATSSKSETADWQLLEGRILAEMGDAEAAQQVTLTVYQRDSLPPVLRAEAASQLADFASQRGEFARAVALRQEAIKLSAPHRRSAVIELRRAALRVLADAHLGMASDIAWGDWAGKSESAPRWLRAGHRFADLLISQEDEDELLAQRVHRRTLAMIAGLRSTSPVRVICREALEHGQDLIARAEDPLYRQRVQWELAETMYFATLLQRDRGECGEALEYAGVAIPLLEAAQRQRELTPREQFLTGQVHFLKGACHGLQEHNHAAAVRAYEKAAPLLCAAQPGQRPADIAMIGDQLVTIGVSFWKDGQRDRAIEFSRLAAEKLLAVSQTQDQPLPSLAVCCRNLSLMLNTVGQEAEADEWARRAAELE